MITIFFTRTVIMIVLLTNISFFRLFNTAIIIIVYIKTMITILTKTILTKREDSKTNLLKKESDCLIHKNENEKLINVCSTWRFVMMAYFMIMTAFHLPLLSCTTNVIHFILFWPSWRTFHIMWKYISNLGHLIKLINTGYTHCSCSNEIWRQENTDRSSRKKWWNATNASHNWE